MPKLTYSWICPECGKSKYWSFLCTGTDTRVHDVRPALQCVPMADLYREKDANAELKRELDKAHYRIRLMEKEKQAVLNAINLFADEVLHDALDAIGWPTEPTEGNQE
jgi:hypothetical protein